MGKSQNVGKKISIAKLIIIVLNIYRVRSMSEILKE